MINAKRLFSLRNLLLVALCSVLVVGVLFVRADLIGFTWNPDVGFGLTYYDSVIDASVALYFTSFLWDDTNASSVTFSNVYTSGGYAYDYLSVSSDVNATFSVVSADELTYGVVSNGTQTFGGTSAPSSVVVDGLDWSDWSFAGGVLTVNNASSTVDILFDVSDLAVEDVLAVAVLFGVIAIAVVFVFIRRKKSNGDIYE